MGITFKNCGKEKKGKKKGYTFGLAFAFFLFLTAILPQNASADWNTMGGTCDNSHWIQGHNSFSVAGAAFVADVSGSLDSYSIKLAQKNYSSSDTIKAVLYEVPTGITFGTGSFSGSNPVSSMNTIAFSSLSGSYSTETFTFSGATLVSGSSYYLAVVFVNGNDSSNTLYPCSNSGALTGNWYAEGNYNTSSFSMINTGSIVGSISVSSIPVTAGFTSFSFSTTTQTVNVQGAIIGTSTPLAWSQVLQVWKLTQVGQFNEWGREYLGSFRATSTENFNVTYSYLPNSTVSGNNNIYGLVAGTVFEADIKQETSTGLELVVSTSTALTATTTQFIYDVTTGQLIWNSTMGSTSTTTGSDTNFLGFLNVPNLLATKWPFAYIFQISQVLISEIASSTPTAIPSSSFNVHLGIAGHASTTLQVDMFSTSTIAYFLTPTTTSTLRALMVAVTYFSTLWFLFHEAKHKKLL